MEKGINRPRRQPITLPINPKDGCIPDIAYIAEVMAPVKERIRALMQSGSVAVAICGGPVIGKSKLFTPALVHGFKSIGVISEDDYCIGNSRSQLLHGKPDLHVPEDYDPELLAGHIVQLKNGESVEKPVYSFATRERIGQTRFDAADLLVVEGEFLLYPPVRDQFDIKVFIHTDDHSRFVRRIIRQRRNPKQTDLARVMEYFTLTYPNYHSIIEPTAGCADYFVDNHYHPLEGKERVAQQNRESLFETKDGESLFASMFPHFERRRFSMQYYSHPRHSEGEMMHITRYESGENVLQYSPGIVSIDNNGITIPWVAFDLEECEVDLSKIGYSPMCRITGRDILVRRASGIARFVQLNDGREIIYFSESAAEETPASFCHEKQCLLRQGEKHPALCLSFDEWVLRQRQ
ncbi:MAG: hypothetical protein PHS73_00165 [Candidatus Peribacteraceae bacterium]|nr:hypothetical protein [Candidatus Peribacteraceae bacterium]